MNHYDKVSIDAKDADAIDLQLKPVSESYEIPNVHWGCTDEITYLDGRTEVVTGHNIVVKDVSKLIAALFSEKLKKGIQYWAIGSGVPAWDSQWNINPPTPDVNAKKLINEFYRHPVKSEDMTFVDNNDDEVTDGTITNKIKIVILVGYNEGLGDWREFGLVGGNATNSKDTGIMIDHKYHKIISKTDEMSIKRTIIIEF